MDLATFSDRVRRISYLAGSLSLLTEPGDGPQFVQVLSALRNAQREIAPYTGTHLARFPIPRQPVKIGERKFTSYHEGAIRTADTLVAIVCMSVDPAAATQRAARIDFDDRKILEFFQHIRLMVQAQAARGRIDWDMDADLVCELAAVGTPPDRETIPLPSRLLTLKEIGEICGLSKRQMEEPSRRSQLGDPHIPKNGNQPMKFLATAPPVAAFLEANRTLGQLSTERDAK